MAGAGYKLFATGDVLTAAQVNTYLMQQTVMVFASSAARTSALSGVLAEGMVSYLQDTNTLEVYDGSAWIGATGDITALTAGTGVSITNPTGPVPTVAIDTAVTADLTTAQTLTNKTLTSPVLTTPSISNIAAKGDILVGTADNTLGIITAGSNGQLLTADSTSATGLSYQNNFAAGKNKIINGDFGIWQRGTTFTSVAQMTYLADRWASNGSSNNFSRQTFTPGTAPVSGYEGSFFLRCTATSQQIGITQRIEDVRSYAGQTVTISFWAKADSARTLSLFFDQNFGSGGSAQVDFAVTTIASLTTSWARYTYTVAVPSISGKTIGTSSYLDLTLYLASPTGSITLDFWGIQLEAGSNATAFQTATGTIQGELAACQRYYWRNSADTAFAYVGNAANAWSTTEADLTIQNPVPMRVPAASVEYSTLILSTRAGGTTYTVTSATLASTAQSKMMTQIRFGVASGLTATVRYDILANNSTSAYLAISAEL
jgi:hypothetical protein